MKSKAVFSGLAVLFAVLFVLAGMAHARWVYCGTCGGSGRVQEGQSCSKCGGGGWTSCYRCNGNGAERCTFCWGSGSVNVQRGYETVTEPCDNCGGAGQYSCGRCGGTGQEQCSFCGGQGETYFQVTCPTCNGEYATWVED